MHSKKSVTRQRQSFIREPAYGGGAENINPEKDDGRSQVKVSRDSS